MSDSESPTLGDRSAELVDFFRSCIGDPNVMSVGGPPFTRWLAPTLVEVDAGRVVFDVVAREEMTNPAGLLHGGIQCAILDDAIGLAAHTLGRDGFHLSVNLATDYLGPASLGDTVRATGEIVRQGGRIVHARGRLAHLDGTPIAAASSNLVRSPSTELDLPSLDG